MKKLIATILSLALLGVMALPAAAQNRFRDSDDRAVSRNARDLGDRNREDSIRQQDIYAEQQRALNDRNGYYYGYDNRSFWDKHRDKLTTGLGAIGGAILGSAIGGGRGAAVGTIAGAAGAALYSYKIRNRGY